MTDIFHPHEELIQLPIQTSDLDALRMAAGTLGVSVAEVVRSAVRAEVDTYKTDLEKRATVVTYISKLQHLIGEVSIPVNTGILPVPDERLSR